MDLFKKIEQNMQLSPLGRHAKEAHGYFTYPKLEGEISSRMLFRGKKVITWSINNYLGLSNHPEIREADTKAASDWGLGTPMGSRMMSGETKFHEQLENELSDFVQKEKTGSKVCLYLFCFCIILVISFNWLVAPYFVFPIFRKS